MRQCLTGFTVCEQTLMSICHRNQCDPFIARKRHNKININSNVALIRWFQYLVFLIVCEPVLRKESLFVLA